MITSEAMEPIVSDNQSVETLVFNESDYNTCPSGTDSPFDVLLRRKWTEASAKDNVFRYKVTENSLPAKRLSGRYGMIAQLNEGRAVNRRPPQTMRAIRQPFNGQAFNFTRINSQEILFKVESSDGRTSGTVIVNQSPIEYCNALLVPSLDSCRPQVLTTDALELAISLVALSGRQSLRVGFNSLGAMASVNHQHFHVYYYDHPMLLESLPVRDNRLTGWPIETFVFELTVICAQTVRELTERVHKVVDHCLDANIAHNVFVSRATGAGVRVFVWPREPVFGAKDDMVINPAFCEFTGLFMCKSRDMYDTIDEEFCVKLLSEVNTRCDHLQHLL